MEKYHTRAGKAATAKTGRCGRSDMCEGAAATAPMTEPTPPTTAPPRTTTTTAPEPGAAPFEAKNADTPPCRSYHSPVRQLQADTTRHRILDAAERLLAEHGYTRSKITDIAREAGVAAPTIYATFKSKCGILAALIDRKLYTPAFYALRDAAINATEPREKLRSVTRLIAMVYDIELPCRLQNLSGAGAIDPDLWEFITDRERQRRVYQEPLIVDLFNAGCLRPDFSPEQALDTLWALTARPLFAMLRFERGWTPHEYADWLFAILESSLLAPQPSAS